MAVTYSAVVKDARMQSVADAIDQGASAGKLEVGTAGMGVVLFTIIFDKPCGAINSGALIFNGFPKSDNAAAASGVATAARIRDGNNADVITDLTVGFTGVDIVMDSNVITEGQLVTINLASITHG